MSQRIGIALLISLCSCSTSEPPPSPPPAAPPALPGVAAPDTGSLPPSARLIPEPVDSVDDVPGTYAQPYALPGQVSVIAIGPTALGTGEFELYRSCGLPACLPEAGQYDIVPTNPAIGFAALTLVDQTDTLRVTYVLDYLWRDSDGRLVAIQLRALVGNSAGPTQVWWRLPDATGIPPGAGATPAAPAAVGTVFVRALPIYGDIGAITIDDTAWTTTTASGTYDASYPYCLPWCLGEAGDYELDLANVATGTGQLSLVPAADPTAAHDYAVYAIFRALDGTPAAIQLQRFDGVVASGPPFTLYRQWWTDAGAAAP